MSAELSRVEDYGWGMDGLGRAHLCAVDGRVVLLCGLPGVSGPELIYYWLESNA